MLKVTLRARRAKDDTAHEAEIALPEEDCGTLRAFLGNVARLAKAALVQNGLPGIQQISMTGEELAIEVGPVDYGQVCELLHLARPIFLSREPASFEKTIAVFGRVARGTFLAEQLKHIRFVYENGDYKPYFQVTIGDVPLFHDDSLKVWLNGVEYHQDADKAAKIRELEEVLGPEVTRGVFIAQLAGRLEATFKLAELARFALGQGEWALGKST